MATKQVIVYFLNDSERAAALRVLSNPTATESFILGSIDESAIPSLRAEGLIVQEQQDAVAASDQQQAQKIENMNALGFPARPAVADAMAVPEPVNKNETVGSRD